MSARLAAASLAAGLVAALAAGVGIDVRGSYGAQVTGDEPQYLLTAISLGEDGSLDIADELVAERYRAFHEADLPEQTKPLLGGRRVSPHDPLLPALLAGPVAAGGWVGAKLALAAIAGLLAALTVWTAVARFGAPLAASFTAATVFGASAPLAVYGSQVYPELPAALLVLVAVAALAGARGRAAVAAAGLALALLPWLAVKYVPVAAAIAAAALWLLVRDGRRARAAALALGLAAAGAVYAALHLRWYGGLTPYATGDHFVGGELTAVGTDPDLAGRSRRLVGLLVDDTFGLAAWQPAYLLALPALGALAVARPRGASLLVLPLAAGWLSATFVALTMQGWWFPGRQVVVVLPLAVVAIAWWAGASRVRLGVLAGVGLLGIASYGLLVADGLRGRLTWVVDFYETGNPLYGVWHRSLPDYLDVTAATWVLHGAWAAVLVALLALGARGAARQKTATRLSTGLTLTRAPSGTSSFDGRCETSTVPSARATR